MKKYIDATDYWFLTRKVEHLINIKDKK